MTTKPVISVLHESFFLKDAPKCLVLFAVEDSQQKEKGYILLIP